MLFDLVSYFPWLIAALGIGVVVGWRTYLDTPRRNWRDGWIIWGALAFVVGVIVAALKLVPGRYGLWLEIALLMIAVYIVGCFLGGVLKKLLGAHESGGAAVVPAATDSRNGTKLEAERQATAKAAADRLAVEVAAKAEADRKAAAARAEAAKVEADRLAAEAAAKAEAERARAEIERKAAAAAKAEAARVAAVALAKAEADRLTAAAVAKALEDRRALAVKAEPAPATPTRKRGSSERRSPPPTRRRIVLWRKPSQRPGLHEKPIRPPKPRRVVWLQRVSQRSRLGETPPSRPTRPMRRRTLWLRRLPRPRPIGTLSLHYLRRRSEQT
jgi:hypothetical protein